MAMAMLVALSLPSVAMAGDPSSTVADGSSLTTASSASAVTVDDKLVQTSDYSADGRLATATHEVTLTNTSDVDVADYKLYDTLVNGTYLGNSIAVVYPTDATVTYATAGPATTGTFTVDNISAKGTVTFTYQARIDVSALGASNQLKPADSTWNLTNTRVTGNRETAADTSSLNVGDDAWYLVEIDNSEGTQAVSVADATLTDTFSNLTYLGAGTVSSGSVSTDGSTVTFTPAADVAAGDKVQIWLHYAVASSATDASGGTASSPADMVESTVATNGRATTTDTPVVTVALAKTLDTVAYNNDGSATLSYTLTLKNTSESIATNYQVADTMSSGSINDDYTASDGTQSITGQVGLDGSVFTIATIAPTTGTVSISYRVTVPAADMGKQISNQAKPADATWNLSRSRVAGEDSETSIDDSSLSVGDDVWYLVEVDNTAGAQSVSVADATVTSTFSGLTYQGASTSDGTVESDGNGNLTFTPGADVAAGSKARAWLHFTVSNAATVVCTSSTNSHASVTEQSTVKVDAAKDISSVTYDSDGTAAVAYTVTLTNESDVPADGYRLADALTGGTVDENSWSVTGTDNTVTYESDVFTIGTIPAQSSVTLTYTATMGNSSDLGVTDVNEAKSAGSAWDLTDTRVTGDGSETNANDTICVGEDVWYLITVDNTEGTENISAADATVTDAFANLTYVGAGTATQGSVSDNGTTVTFAPGEVAAGSKAQVWLHFYVARSATHSSEAAYNPKLAGVFVNTAKADGHAAATNDPVAHVDSKKEATKVTYNTDGTATVDYKVTLTNARNGVVNDYAFVDGPANASIDVTSIKGATFDNGDFVVDQIAARATQVVTYTATIPTSELNATNLVSRLGSMWSLDATRVGSDGATSEATGVLFSGDTVWYLVEVDNTADTTDTDVISAADAAVTDTFSNLTYVGSGQVKVVDQNGDDVSGATLGTVTSSGTSTVTFAPGEVAAGTKAQVWLQFAVAGSATDSTDASYQSGLAGTVADTASASGTSIVVTSPVATVNVDKDVQKVSYGADGTTATTTYKVTLTNASDVSVSDYQLSDALTNGTYVDGSIAGIVASDGSTPAVRHAGTTSASGAFTVSDLPAGSTVTFTYQVAVPQSAQAGSSEDKPAGSAWDLTLARVAGSGSAAVATGTPRTGDDVWYLVSVDNAKGTQAVSVADATVCDTFTNLTYVGASTTDGSVTTDGASAAAATTVTFTPATEVAAGGTARAWLHFTVNANATDATTPLQSTIINKASAGSHVTTVNELVKKAISPTTPEPTTPEPTTPEPTTTEPTTPEPATTGAATTGAATTSDTVTPDVSATATTATPQTGDTTSAGLPALLVASALLLATSWLLRKGTRRDR
ncbi:MAG: hypothetical protein LKG13_00310 [Atopobiaceae bacterium]|jgi:hypothetical protein|nr:hypothetical protein [Atopobiaceae bacterium]MCI1259105.1 hypothetical protein [Atopobiaceae bacterium]